MLFSCALRIAALSWSTPEQNSAVHASNFLFLANDRRRRTTGSIISINWGVISTVLSGAMVDWLIKAKHVFRMCSGTANDRSGITQALKAMSRYKRSFKNVEGKLSTQPQTVVSSYPTNCLQLRPLLCRIWFKCSVTCVPCSFVSYLGTIATSLFLL